MDKDYELTVWGGAMPFVEHRSFIGSLVVYQKGSQPREERYQHLDRLGSLDAVTTAAGVERLDGSGFAVDAHGYDAFGAPRRRDWVDSVVLNPYGAGTSTRGFTGHEHLDAVTLIHMNGRVYDYRLGRFLSVDPIISNPLSSQAINPYSYIGNNPLSGVDPTGYEWSLLVSALEYVDSFIGTSVSARSSSGATGRSPAGGSVTDAESPSAVSRDTNWGAVAAGAAFGTVQALTPGGVLTGSPAPGSADFEAGRAAGLIATGTVQAVLGAAEVAAGAAGAVVTSPTGVGAVAGGAVAVAGAAVAVQGAANVTAGAAVAAHAMEMRSSGDGGGPDLLKPGPHAGQSVPATGPRVTAGQKAELTKIGQETGCHSCGTKDFGTKSGKPVGDHQPATALKEPGAKQELYPQCTSCSAKQGAEVRKEMERR